MKNIILTLFVFLFMISCRNDINLKGTIQGVVETNKKTPVAGAKVSIFYLDESGMHDVSKSLETSADGTYSFPEMSYCTFRLEVSKTGYIQQSKAFVLAENTFYYRVELNEKN